MNTFKPNLYFHIGTPKTGTTSIQRALRLLDGLEGSYVYPEPIITESHLLESALLLKDCGVTVDLAWAPEVMRAFRESSETTLSNLLSSWYHSVQPRFLDSLNQQQPSLILSCEFLIKYLGSAKTLKQIKNRLDNFNVVFVLYLRRLDDHCNSEVMQTLKEGFWSSNDSLKILKSNRRHTLTRFHQSIPLTLQRIRKVFGPNSVKLRPFERCQLFKNDVVFDFMNSIGIPCDFDYTNTVQNRTPPVDFLLYFSDQFGGPRERDPLAHTVFRQICGGSQIYELSSPETSNVYSWDERNNMLSDVSVAYADLGQLIADTPRQLFLSAAPSRNELFFRNTMSLERVSLFDTLISQAFASRS